MARDPDSDFERLDWLDLEPTVAPEPTGRGLLGSPRTRRRWHLVAALAVLVLLVGLIQHVRSSAADRSATPAPTPTPLGQVTHPPSSPTARPDASATATVNPITVTELKHPILGITGGWELFGRGPGGVVRLEFARGRVTRVSLPSLRSDGGVSFIAGTDRVIVRPWDQVAGYSVPDNGRPQPLSGLLSNGGTLYPGPSPDRMWMQLGYSSGPGGVVAVDMSGRQIGAPLSLPTDQAMVGPDGAGQLLFSGIGGAYDARGGSVQRITSGSVIAIGPSGWLTIDCDEQYRCRTYYVDRATRSRRQVSRPFLNPYLPTGAISPDGRTAAMIEPDQSGMTAVHLVDLATGSERVPGVPVDQNVPESSNIVWSPDSKWLFVAAAEGRLTAIDAAGATPHPLGVALPQISQIAIRPASGG